MIEHPHAGIFSQKQHGLNYIGVAVPVGQLDSYQLMALARVAAMYGNNTVRLTVWQNVLLPGIQIEDLEKAKAALLEVGLDWKQSNLKSGVIACTGNRYCPYAKSDTKGHALEISKFLEEHLETDQSVNIHFTGCAFSCAQHYVGDIGLLAAGRKAGEEEAYHVFRGGGFGTKRSIGKKVSDAPVAAPQLKPYLLAILQEWLEKRNPGESFQDYSQRIQY